MNRIEQRWINRLIITLLCLLILYMVVQLAPLLVPFKILFHALLLPLGAAILLTYLMHPLVEKLHEVGVARSIAVLLIFLGISATFGFLITIGLPAIIRQIDHALTTLPNQIKVLQDVTTEVQQQMDTLPTPLQSHTEEWKVQLEKMGEKVLDQIEAVAVFLLKSVLSFMVIPFLVFFFLKDYDLIKRMAWYVTPRRWRHPLQRYVEDVDHAIGSYIRGQLLVALAVGVLSATGLGIIGVPYPILLGLFLGAMELIPFFGPFIGAVPVLILAAIESWQLALYSLILILILQQIEGNILSPLIVGKTLQLHPATIIIALLIGVEVGGVIGMLIAVPIVAIGKVTLLHIRAHMMKD